MSKRKFVFTVTTGRSGTTYLAELLRANITDAAVYHERSSFLRLGLDSPDASHFTLFNSVGNVDPVVDFWRRKTARILSEPELWYVETSHFLAKAGLLENIGPLTDVGDVYVILLTRDIAQTVRSFVMRHAFENYGSTWLSTLDVRYPNKIVNHAPLQGYGMPGIALWYVIEMQVRGEYYRLLLKDLPNVHFIDASLADISESAGAGRLLERLVGPQQNLSPVVPGRKNENRGPALDGSQIAAIDKMIRDKKFDPAALAKAYFDRGLRLEDGVRVFRDEYNKLLAIG